MHKNILYSNATAANDGFAIYRIEHDWPIQEEPGARTRKDYTGGEYVEFIKS
jgi:hypothetical protein